MHAVGVRAPHDREVEHAGEANVANEARRSAQEAVVLEAGDRPAGPRRHAHEGRQAASYDNRVVAQMSDVRPVALIGAGTIARTVGGELAAGRLEGLGLHGFLCRRGHADLPGGEFATLEALLVPRVVVVEAASHGAVRDYGADVLAAGADLVCVSVGALADAGLRERLADAGARGGGRLLVPSGAIGGLDLLRAAAEAGLDEVVIEQRKPAAALLPAPEAAALAEPRVVFDGSVADVVVAFPKTTNVAAAVALAGLGFARTRAVVVADPDLRANEALLRARGGFGTLRLRLENVATANPRTSTIVAYSVLATLRRLGEWLVVPA